MKIYLDSANLKEIQQAAELGFVDGVTTNLQMLRAEHAELDELVPEICSRIGGTVSVPVRSVSKSDIVAEAHELAVLDDNVVVKIPVHREGLRAIAALQPDNIRTHATLCCNAAQALLAAKCGAWFVSPFFSRLEAAGRDARDVVGEILEIYEAYGMETEVMVASLRNPRQVVELAKLGADGCTVPYALLDELYADTLSEVLLHENSETRE